MQIQRYLKPRDTLENFAAKHGLIMEVHERDLGHSAGQFYAHFQNAEVKDGACLVGTHGNGCTEDGAITQYAREISGKRLVIDAYKDSRREIEVPILEAPTWPTIQQSS